jgi:DNA-binding NtrC family response regulator
VRELANVCERLAILHPGRGVGRAELAALLAPESASRPADVRDELPLHDRLDAFERELIEDALDARTAVSPKPRAGSRRTAPTCTAA